MNILVTGAASPLGTAICEELQAQKHHVTGTLRPGGNAIRPSLLHETVYLDLTNPLDFQKISGNFDAIIHVAALSQGSPQELMQATGLSTWYLLERATALNINVIVHVSSMSVYGKPFVQQVGSQTPIQHSTPYGAAKWAAECFLSSNQSTLKSVSVRAPAIVGPRSHRHFLANVLGQMKRQVPEICLSNPTFLFNNIIHDTVLSRFLIKLAVSPPHSYFAMPVCSVEPLPLFKIIENLADTVQYKGRIKWVRSSEPPFSIDSKLAVSYGLEAVSTQETLRLWCRDILRKS